MLRANVSADLGSGLAETVDVVERLLDARHSCRAFQDRPVDRAVIKRILEIAQRSPSWCNTQPWEVFVTDRARYRGGGIKIKRVPRGNAPRRLSYEGQGV